MLRTRSAVRPLTLADRDDALALCARDPVRHVFVAARILESARNGSLSGLLSHRHGHELTSICWASANVVPVESTQESRVAFAEKIRRWRGRTASVLGPREEVGPLWSELEPAWGPARAVRVPQPLMVTTTPPSRLGLTLDARVRPARPDEVDIVLPAATHMFTHEIGYAPYAGSSRGYRVSLAGLISRGHTFVVQEHGEVIFKADVGSFALGSAQIQGVWLAPHLRGLGLSTAMMAGVVEQVFGLGASSVSLYVNGFNTSAHALYERVGFTTVGEFTTILL